MADIRKRTFVNGSSWQLRYTDASGKERYKSFAKKKDAATFMQALGGISAAPEAKNLSAKAATLGDALDVWLTVCETVGRNGREPVEPHTLRHYTTEARHLRELTDTDGTLFVGKSVNKLNGPDMVRIRDALLQKHSRHMARRIFVSLKGALSEAESRGDIAAIPGQRVSVVISSRHKPHVVIPEPSDVSLILAGAAEALKHPDGRVAAAWPRYRVLIEVLTFAGIRPSEARGLPRRNIDVSNATITISQRADEMGALGPPKTTAGFRTINIPRRVADMLGEWLKVIPDTPNTLVFGNGAGNAESLANITNRCWHPLIKRAGLIDEDGRTKFNLYSLRHHRASTEIAAGANAKDIQQLMGHENVTTTLNIYGHLFAEAQGRRIERAEQMDESLRHKSATETYGIPRKPAELRCGESVAQKQKEAPKPGREGAKSLKTNGARGRI